jgi:hypothetical protein
VSPSSSAAPPCHHLPRVVDLTNRVPTCLTSVRHDADPLEPLQRALAGPSAMGVDMTSRPYYTRPHARSSMVSARERRFSCVPHRLTAGRGDVSWAG